MDKLNYAFFEEFKHLDRICGEIYQSQRGVTDYIENMKSVPESRYRDIQKWKDDLKQLQRLRHIRNHLAHEEGAFDINVCTQRDIDWVRAFYERILNQCDPIAVLRQNAKHGRKPYKNQITDQLYNEKDREMKTFHSVMIVIVIDLIIALIVVVSLIVMMR